MLNLHLEGSSPTPIFNTWSFLLADDFSCYYSSVTLLIGMLSFILIFDPT
jgi:hypothetical protein